MSKLFIDNLIDFEDLDIYIKKIATSQEEKEELWKLLDEIIHHKVLDLILGKLPRDSHDEFLTIFHSSPHDEVLIFNYLKEKIDQNIEEILKQEFGLISNEIISELRF